jgi:nicotinamide-nucleotide amidase
LEGQALGVLPFINDYVFGYGKDELEEVIGQMLIESKATLATAESFSGGTISSLITSVAGSSAYFLGGVIAYDNEVKIRTLGVDRQLIIDFGAVSAPVAEAMAVGAQQMTGATYAIATTGIAGPGGGTELKPVGLVYSAIAYPGGVFSIKQQLLVDRQLNIKMGSLWALNLLRQHLLRIL